MKRPRYHDGRGVRAENSSMQLFLLMILSEDISSDPVVVNTTCT
jgi:hypothetical protein